MDPNQKSITENDVKKVKKANKVFKVLGPLMILLGIILFIAGVISASQFGDLFFLTFIGIFSLFIGAVMTMFGYLGSMQRHLASNASVARGDTANYMVDGTSDAVSDLVEKVLDKASNSKTKKQKVCPSCQALNDYDMKYCGECGGSLASKKGLKVKNKCPSCGANVPSEASSCPYCNSIF